MTHRLQTLALTAFVVLSSTIAFAQDVAPDAVAAPVDRTDPVGEAPPEPIESTDPASSEPVDTGDPTTSEEPQADTQAPAEESGFDTPAETDEPMGGLASFAIAYGTGLATAGVAYGLMVASQGVGIASLILGAAATPILGPISNVLAGLSLFACCFLPAGQGALINVLGDTVTGSDPSLAYLWTIIASYVSCYAFSCVGLTAYIAIAFVVGGAVVFAALTGQPIPDAENYTYLFAGTLLGIFGAVAVVQPLVPAAVYAMSRDTGESKEESDEYVDTDDEYVRAPSAPGARPEFALGSMRAAAMAF